MQKLLKSNVLKYAWNAKDINSLCIKKYSATKITTLMPFFFAQHVTYSLGEKKMKSCLKYPLPSLVFFLRCLLKTRWTFLVKKTEM